MGVAKEYPDLYGTKPGTKAASLWDQWHVLQEQNKPKRPVEKYHIDFNSNKVETSVAPQKVMPSTGARQITAPGVISYQSMAPQLGAFVTSNSPIEASQRLAPQSQIAMPSIQARQKTASVITSYQAMAPQPGAFVTSNPPIEASQRSAPQPKALETSNSSTYAPHIPIQLSGARQRTAPHVSPYLSMASQPRAFITSTLLISAPQFESSQTSTLSTYTPQIPMQLLGD